MNTYSEGMNTVRYLKQGVCLALLGAGLAAVPGIQAAAAGTTGGGSLVEQMRDTAQGSVALSTSSATGKVGFIRAGRGGDLMPGVAAQSSAQAAAKATSYLDDYASAFGARPDELVQGKTMSTPYGWTVSYTQAYHGVPVFGSMLKANIDRDGDLTSVNGYAAPGLSLSTTPQHSASEAAQRAIAFVKANPAEGVKDMSGLEAAVNQLVVYRMGAVKGEAGDTILAHQIEVTNKKTVRDTVIVDATTGKVVNRYSMMDTALDRHLFEAVVETTTPALDFDQVWDEGDPLAGRPQRRPGQPGRRPRATPTGSTTTPGAATPTTATAPRCTRSTTTRASPAPTPTGTASRPTTATASPPTTWSPTSGATPTPSTPPA